MPLESVMKVALALFVAILGLPTLAAADVVVPIETVKHFVNIRADANADSDIIGRLYQGDSMPLVQSADGWHEIEIETDLNGYTSSNWTTVVSDADLEAAVANADDATIAPNSSVPAQAEPDPPAEPVVERLTETARHEQSSPVDVVEETPVEEIVFEQAMPAPTVEAAEVQAIVEVEEPEVVPGPQGPRGEMGPQGPPGPAGPAGIASLEGSVSFLTKFTEPTVGGSSQVYDDGRNIGIGTTDPKQRLEVNGSIQIHERNSSVAGLMITQSSGETGYIMHNLGSTLTIGAGSVDRITIDGAGNVGFGQERPTQPLEMASGAHVTVGGVWTNSSSRKDKENIADLTFEEALAVLAALEPVRFNYKADSEDDFVGFIAEDVPDLVASKDRNGLSAMDIVAVLTKVVQAQQAQIEELEARLIK